MKRIPAILQHVESRRRGLETIDFGPDGPFRGNLHATSRDETVGGLNERVSRLRWT